MEQRRDSNDDRRDLCQARLTLWAAPFVGCPLHGNRRASRPQEWPRPGVFPASPHGPLDVGTRERPVLERIVRQISGNGQRSPAAAARVRLSGRYCRRSPALPQSRGRCFRLWHAAARSICLNCLMVSLLFAGIKLSSFATRRLMPKLLTQGGFAASPASSAPHQCETRRRASVCAQSLHGSHPVFLPPFAMVHVSRDREHGFQSIVSRDFRRS